MSESQISILSEELLGDSLATGEVFAYSNYDVGS